LNAIVVRSAARIDWLVFSALASFDGDIEARDVAGGFIILPFAVSRASRSPVFKIHDSQTAELA
jgi:hypothetical protein